MAAKEQKQKAPLAFPGTHFTFYLRSKRELGFVCATGFYQHGPGICRKVEDKG